MDTKALYTYFKQCNAVTTDSRNCPKGSLFFALKGDSFDGNAYAANALEKGCAYAVIDNPQYAVANDGRYLLVDNVLQAMQQLATYHRRQWGKTIIQITGTNGKTTTKELTAAVLASTYRVLYTEGNLNNHIGVPLTLLRLRDEHQMAIIETGANHPGEIAMLSQIVEPDYGLITNVGKAHLEGFGSFEGVIQTKTELYRYLEKQNNGTVFINNDNSYLTPYARHLHGIGYGTPGSNPTNYTEGEVVECTPFLTFRWHEKEEETWYTVHSQLIGSYNIDNFLAAITIGRHFHVPAHLINRSLANYVPTNNRSQLVDTGRNRLIVDAYNANPTSMMAALCNFRDIQATNKMLILGEMRELGTNSTEEHQRIIDFLHQNDFAQVWLVGSAFQHIDHKFRHFEAVEQVMAELEAHPVSGCLILIKGSNGTKLFKLPSAL